MWISNDAAAVVWSGGRHLVGISRRTGVTRCPIVPQVPNPARGRGRVAVVTPGGRPPWEDGDAA